jgi:hypothetical protein
MVALTRNEQWAWLAASTTHITGEVRDYRIIWPWPPVAQGAVPPAQVTPDEGGKDDSEEHPRIPAV